MHLFQSRLISVPWLFAVTGSWVLLILAMTPPWLGDGVGSAVMAGFSFFCHQFPERSFHVHGGQLALCHRCFGIVVGLMSGSTFVAPLISVGVRKKLASGTRPGVLLMLAVIPTALDWFVGAFGIWANTPVSRFATGVLFGLAAGIVLASSLLVSRSSADTQVGATLPSLIYHST